MTAEAGTLSKIELEEGSFFAPRFDRDGLITCVTVDAADGTVLMVAHMNAEALRLTLETGIAHYWSRSRQALWRKGDTSGQTQAVVDVRTDCDQDALLMRVRPGGDGGACHTGRRSCFYRIVTSDSAGPALAIDPL
ncbi:phosphoribosyl-AMP cyclohydrolase [Beijerinckia sp. L45]|uniref:phosphoribosyl-AMP cyclohydrolase n=1 Tax=Beijerinckia sp. L45 TaxID=1641855 RepID=UPI001FEEAFEF|nr:phosphoribosyl-AMP cyclohydrolase [Beijerinckia sp. L45]